MASPMAMALGRRDISSTIDGVKSSFSSWDACMSKAYCKWPVIAAIAIAGMIVFSLLWCCGRCLCCGAQCCCSCLSCCNACCPNPRGGHKRVASPPPSAFPNNAQYQSQPPPVYSNPGWSQQNDVPQYATFDASTDKKFNEDALPAMPTWETAKATKVEVNETMKEQPDDMEMQRLDLKPTSTVSSPSPMNPRSPPPPSDYAVPVQPQPIHPPHAAFASQNMAAPDAYQTMHDYNNGADNAGYFNGQQPQQYGGMSRHASPAPYQDQSQPYHYATDPYGGGYGQDRGVGGGGGYGQPYDTQSGYAPSNAPTGYAPSGSTRYEPSMHNVYQDPYQQQQQQQPPMPPMPPMPPIDRAGTASPYHQPRAPFDRAATASPYQHQPQPFRPPVDRVATSSPYQTFNPGPGAPSPVNGSRWERMGANRNAPGGYRDV